MKRFHVSNLPRTYQLEQESLSLWQGSMELSTYFTKMKTLWLRLASTKSQKICKCECGKVEELLEDAETRRIIQFLMGLNDSYANIRGQIINKKHRPSLSVIYNMLDQDQSQRRLVLLKRPCPLVAFQVTAKDVFDSVTKYEGSVNAAETYNHSLRHVCSHCGIVGHLKDRCYKIHGYPPG